MKYLRNIVFLACLPSLLAVSPRPALGQTHPSQAASSPAARSDAEARQLVRDVVYNELTSAANDHSRWMYLDTEKTPGKSTVKLVIQTPEATLSRTIEIDGRAPTAQERQQDQAKMENLVNNPKARQKQKANGEHDDKQSASLLKILPDAFIWTETGTSDGEVHLDFKPNPSFQPPTYASRVFAAMAGTMTVDAPQKRLKMLSGTLIQPVEFGWGLFGKLQQGGTFQVTRQEITPRVWQITGTHVHIQGHILFFKSISQQEDEETSHYKPTPPDTTLRQAADMLNDGTVARDLGVTEPN